MYSSCMPPSPCYLCLSSVAGEAVTEEHVHGLHEGVEKHDIYQTGRIDSIHQRGTHQRAIRSRSRGSHRTRVHPSSAVHPSSRRAAHNPRRDASGVMESTPIR
uniref:Uncharacterized protein n=1 Tax=Oryza meridionalis TaxID=40149 RepID=A0A0E0EN13_9ORYZ